MTDVRLPINLGATHFIEHKYAYYRWLLEHAPVCQGRFSVLRAWLVSRYDDCVALLKDPRFVRNRTTATGGGRLPFPVPRSVTLVAQSMIIEDEPAHRRLRNLVHQAFTPRAVAKLEPRIESLTHELLDRALAERQVDLMRAYSLPIPATVIQELLGIDPNDMPRFVGSIRTLTSGLSGWNLARTLLWDLPRSTRFMRELIARKRRSPQDDLLTGLLHAEDQGDRLTEGELISMVYLLIVAGYETTVHLINNSVVTLLEHPEQLRRLRETPALMETAIEEVLRFNGPVQGTKPAYAMEDVTVRGITIPRGARVIPLLGAANRDPEAFDNPDRFDIARSPNRHLGFGQGIHYCLGAPLARLETKIALTTLLERSPGLRLAVAPAALKLQPAALWHRYDSVPVVLR